MERTYSLIEPSLKQSLIIEKLIKGDQIAFSYLYDLYSKPLYRNIVRLVKNDDVAQELLQDLFLKIWESRAVIDPDKSFKSYLYKIAENLVFMHFRKLSKDRRLVENLLNSYFEFDINAEESMILKEKKQFLENAISRLSPQRQQIYKLCKLEGKSYEQVSKELGISTSTISDHIVKANKSVKQYLLNNQEYVALLIVSQICLHTK
ncbi:RNA polymerase sigma factor [Mucilaginibacter sp. X5P1]|uniref:RNA polymerase sigma factor n=1 Tax=Mucilaginibacter sp. X5P1 TaxID=2723088 RepID=UPI001617A780|nr:sigma-70 family RNA polymerase sigma factor [Mucilaginibacter sp. X5P1]MBB6137702.1 RNA polymerase sigma-70 factor (ECF subfamily) [Mucilaginibacter sp. X5P1]